MNFPDLCRRHQFLTISPPFYPRLPRLISRPFFCIRRVGRRRPVRVRGVFAEFRLKLFDPFSLPHHLSDKKRQQLPHRRRLSGKVFLAYLKIFTMERGGQSFLLRKKLTAHNVSSCDAKCQCFLETPCDQLPRNYNNQGQETVL